MTHSGTLFNHFVVYYMFTNSIFQKGNLPLADPAKISWKPLVYGYLKLNTNRSWNEIDKEGGGRVIRRPYGFQYIGVYMKFNAVNLTVADFLQFEKVVNC